MSVKPNPFGQPNDLGSAYPVTLPVFQGPLDLLLHLIERDELDISEVSLVGVTDQYLRTLELLEELEPGAIADFLMIASRLLFIKSRMLLPKPRGDEDDEEDSADDLIRQLIEYKRFKEVAEQLRTREEAGLRVYVRTAPRPALERRLDLSDVDTAALNAALQRALARIPSDPPMPRVRVYSITVAEQIDNVRSYISSAVERKRSSPGSGEAPASVSFVELLSQKQTRVEVIVTFLAVLELIKQRELVAVQSDTFGEIELMPIDESGDNGNEFEDATIVDSSSS